MNFSSRLERETHLERRHYTRCSDLDEDENRDRNDFYDDDDYDQDNLLMSKMAGSQEREHPPYEEVAKVGNHHNLLMPIMINITMIIILAGKEQTRTRRTTQAGAPSMRRATMAMRYHHNHQAQKFPKHGKLPCKCPRGVTINIRIEQMGTELK